MNIGENIKRIRLEKGWKQSDLAEKSNISRVAIGNYERGDRMPNIEILNKIAEALNVTLDDLYKVNKTLSKKLVDELEYPILKTYGPKDTLEILSTELEIEYSLLDDCLNNDKDLPIDALVKLLEFLCKIDFPLFMKFTEENKSALSDDITLKDAVSEIMAIKLITLENNSFDLFKKIGRAHV